MDEPILTNKQISDRIKEASSLKNNWDGYHSYSPGPASAKRAKQAIEILNENDVPVCNVVPSAEGGIIIVAGNPSFKYADIDCRNNGDIVYDYIDRDNHTVVKSDKINDLSRAINIMFGDEDATADS